MAIWFYIKLWACSTVVMYRIRIAGTGVRFSPGPLKKLIIDIGFGMSLFLCQKSKLTKHIYL